MNDSEIRFREGGAADVPAVIELHFGELGRPLDEVRVNRLLSNYPSMMAEDSGRLVGFAYSDLFAPDLIELANILVARRLRSQGLGTDLLASFEAVTSKQFGAVILANSTLYKDHRSEKRSPRKFYERAGYKVVFTTSASEVYAKRLP
jgi:GNAT superfamily N-acetyltransferase